MLKRSTAAAAARPRILRRVIGEWRHQFSTAEAGIVSCQTRDLDDGPPSILPVALSALGRNKLRTALTMLGITIGIAAVICTVAIGEGGSSRIREQLQNLGDNFVWVEAGSRNLQGVRTGTGADQDPDVARRAGDPRGRSR